jgi:PleD family two-component response regulator
LPLPILLKDDEADLILHLKQFPNKMGFNTVSFTNPLLAFEHLNYSHRNYSLILKDL